MAQYLTKGVVGEGFRSAVRVVDAQYFAVGFALQRRGLVQRISYGSLITYKIRICKKMIALSKRLHNINC
ncbi:hypothetical protein YSA_10518 [Pseudomonas putida ND6]|uniref:Uncharacterized protein n=1 Tax=Pseudomonas putida ND6 TaxID=231023 RepID=I3V3Z9_PSEPU|nr:hypothetical protein YSA_10518 [Pseudomonas putida ND6]